MGLHRGPKRDLDRALLKICPTISCDSWFGHKQLDVPRKVTLLLLATYDVRRQMNRNSANITSAEHRF